MNQEDLRKTLERRMSHMPQDERVHESMREKFYKGVLVTLTALQAVATGEEHQRLQAAIDAATAARSVSVKPSERPAPQPRSTVLQFRPKGSRCAAQQCDSCDDSSCRECRNG